MKTTVLRWIGCLVLVGKGLNDPAYTRCFLTECTIWLSVTFLAGCASHSDPPNQHLAPGEFRKMYPREYMRSLPPPERDEYERRLNLNE